MGVLVFTEALLFVAYIFTIFVAFQVSGGPNPPALCGSAVLGMASDHSRE